MHQTAAKLAPAVSGDRRIDIEVVGQEAVIKLSEWVDGLGWCGQKTMRLSADLVEDMSRMLLAAKVRLRAEADDDDDILSAKILEFPV